MSLRAKLVLGTVAATLLAAGLHFFLSYAAFKRAVEAELDRDLAYWTQVVAESVVIEDDRPRLKDGDWPWLGARYPLGFRVLRNGRVYLEAGELPRPGQGMRRRVLRPLSEGFALEVFLNAEEYALALKTELSAGWATLPLAALLAALLSLALAGLFTRPLTRLERALSKVGATDLPDPLPEPRGKDELTRLTASFNAMVERVRAAFRRERAFTRYASHELRNPLAALKANLEALDAGLVGKEEGLAAAQDAVRRMEHVLEGLLLLARAPKPAIEPLPLAAIASRIARRLDPRGQRVELAGAEDVWVLADERLLERVLENLLKNALKHGAPPVVLAWQREGGRVQVQVRDHGPGVPPETIPRLTEPFYRAGASGGTGLGLALVQQALEAMGSHLELLPAEPGLSATFSLPTWEADDA